MSETISRIPTTDALTLCLRRWGGGEPQLLLIHGFGDGGYVWEHLLRRCAPLSAVALDLRGHGDSDWDPLCRYTLDVHTADAEAALDAGAMRSAIVIGHSVGAEVAIRLAAKRPAQVRALILVDGGPGVKSDAIDHIVRQFRAQERRFSSVTQYAQTLVERFPMAEASVLARFAERSLRYRAPHGFELKCDPALADAMQRSDSAQTRQHLERVRCPVLIVRGARSGVLPRMAAYTCALELPSCEVVTVPTAGHAVPLDNPAGLHAAVAPFLSKLHSPVVA